MSVDKTIEELSGTLSQLSTLVAHINNQFGGVTARINLTLDTFDSSIAGIAVDANALTGQVAESVRQIPHSWIFYLLFITLIIVLILLSILICINLATKFHAIYRLCFASPEKDAGSPIPSNYSDTRLLQQYEGSLQRHPKSRSHITIPIEQDPNNGVGPAVNRGFTENYQPVRYPQEQHLPSQPYVRRNHPNIVQPLPRTSGLSTPAGTPSGLPDRYSSSQQHASYIPSKTEHV